MKADDFLSNTRMLDWKVITKLQDRIAPILYGLGKSVVVHEVDLRPGETLISAYGMYKERRFRLDCDATPSESSFHLSINIKIGDVPEDFPPAFIAETERLSTEYDIRYSIQNESVYLESTCGTVTTSEELDCEFQHAMEHAQRIEQLLYEQAASPLEGEQPPKESTSAGVVRVLN